MICRLLCLVGVFFAAVRWPSILAAHNSNSDDLYILLDQVNVFTCRGVKNEIRLSEDDVNVLNERGNRVYYIKAPGNYTIHFQRINVLNDFGHLSGELGITLQVPLLEGPAGIRFDLPYTMVPETGLLNQQCDENSGIVERDGRQYCRYCDLCDMSAKIERGLNHGDHKYLPELAKGHEEAFAPSCEQIGASTYEFRRTITLPGRRELEAKVREKMQGVDGELKKRLNKGRGRFQVFLNLISADVPAIRQKAWFDGSPQCRCCGAYRDPSCRNAFSFLYCNTEDCKSAWAQQCLHKSARIAACFTVEFNYRMTDAYSDVVTFLRQHNYPNQDARPTTFLRGRHPLPTREIIRTSSEGNPNPSGDDDEKSPEVSIVSPSDKRPVQEKCVDRMPQRLTHLRRYCTIFWNAKLCCSHCVGIC